jgi:hypothetical protein
MEWMTKALHLLESVLEIQNELNGDLLSMEMADCCSKRFKYVPFSLKEQFVCEMTYSWAKMCDFLSLIRNSFYFRSLRILSHFGEMTKHNTNDIRLFVMLRIETYQNMIGGNELSLAMSEPNREDKSPLSYIQINNIFLQIRNQLLNNHISKAEESFNKYSFICEQTSEPLFLAQYHATSAFLSLTKADFGIALISAMKAFGYLKTRIQTWITLVGSIKEVTNTSQHSNLSPALAQWYDSSWVSSWGVLREVFSLFWLMGYIYSALGRSEKAVYYYDCSFVLSKKLSLPLPYFHSSLHWLYLDVNRKWRLKDVSDHCQLLIDSIRRQKDTFDTPILAHIMAIEGECFTARMSILSEEENDSSHPKKTTTKLLFDSAIKKFRECITTIRDYVNFAHSSHSFAKILNHDTSDRRSCLDVCREVGESQTSLSLHSFPFFSRCGHLWEVWSIARCSRALLYSLQKDWMRVDHDASAVSPLLCIMNEPLIRFDFFSFFSHIFNFILFYFILFYFILFYFILFYFIFYHTFFLSQSLFFHFFSFLVFRTWAITQLALICLRHIKSNESTCEILPPTPTQTPTRRTTRKPICDVTPIESVRGEVLTSHDSVPRTPSRRGRSSTAAKKSIGRGRGRACAVVASESAVLSSNEMLEVLDRSLSSFWDVAHLHAHPSITEEMAKLLCLTSSRSLSSFQFAESLGLISRQQLTIKQQQRVKKVEETKSQSIDGLLLKFNSISLSENQTNATTLPPSKRTALSSSTSTSISTSPTPSTASHQTLNLSSLTTSPYTVCCIGIDPLQNELIMYRFDPIKGEDRFDPIVMRSEMTLFGKGNGTVPSFFENFPSKSNSFEDGLSYFQSIMTRSKETNVPSSHNPTQKVSFLLFSFFFFLLYIYLLFFFFLSSFFFFKINQKYSKLSIGTQSLVGTTHSTR